MVVIHIVKVVLELTNVLAINAEIQILHNMEIVVAISNFKFIITFQINVNAFLDIFKIKMTYVTVYFIFIIYF